MVFFFLIVIKFIIFYYISFQKVDNAFESSGCCVDVPFRLLQSSNEVRKWSKWVKKNKELYENLSLSLSHTHTHVHTHTDTHTHMDTHAHTHTHTHTYIGTCMHVYLSTQTLSQMPNVF